MGMPRIFSGISRGEKNAKIQAFKNVAENKSGDDPQQISGDLF